MSASFVCVQTSELISKQIKDKRMSTTWGLLTFVDASLIFMTRNEAALPALFLIASFTGVFLLSCRCRMKKVCDVQQGRSPLCFRGADVCSSFCFCGIDVCAGRRKRFKKCAKRCEKRKKGSSHSHPEGCWVANNFKTAFAKLHLPPPLPYHRKRPALELRCHFEDCDESSEGSEETALADPNLMPMADPNLMPIVDSNLMPIMDPNAMPMNSNHSLHDWLSDMSSSASISSTTDAIESIISSSNREPMIKTSHPTSRSTLIDTVRMQQWQFIIDHPAKSILLGRKQAKYRDADGLLPLHWACSGAPPVSIVEALLESYPSAARKRDHEGSTPLHFATHYSASVSVVDKLLSVYPEAVTIQDKYGRTPLYHAIEKSANINVIQALIRADKTTTLVSCLPKELRAIHEEVGKDDAVLRRAISIRTPLFLAWTAVLGDAHARKNFQGKKWDKAMHLLMAGYDAISTNSVVANHSSSLPRVPAELFLQAAIALDMYLPDAVVPIAIKNVKDAEAKRSGMVESSDGSEYFTGGEFLAVAAATEQFSEQRSNDLIQMIIEAFPLAASHSTSAGQTPLATAAAAGKLWARDGMNLIFSAAPVAVSQPDPVSGLPPFLLAASATSSRPSLSPKNTKGTIMNASLASNLRMWLEKNDPYNLLTRKVQQREQQQPVASQKDDLSQDYETAKLETIFQLIQSDPSVLSHHL